jgi:hypothetical protein
MTDTMNRKDFDLTRFLHPAGAFRTPKDVAADPDLTLQEKRAILASWASDACAVEASPELRGSPSDPVVRFDAIIDALKDLDGEETNKPHYATSLAALGARRLSTVMTGAVDCSANPAALNCGRNGSRRPTGRCCPVAALFPTGQCGAESSRHFIRTD